MLIGLLAIGAWLLYQDRKPRSHSFRKALVTFDATSITRIKLQQTKTSFSLFKSGDTWRLVVGADKDVRANEARLEDLLRELSEMEVMTLYSRTKDNWQDLQLDSSGVRVMAYVENKLHADIVIGRLEFDHQRQRAYRYARRADEKDAYTLDGMGYAIQADLNFYRDPILVQYSPDSLTNIRFETSNKSFAFRRKGNLWLSDQGVLVDSARMATYIQDTQKIWGVGFEDDRMIDQTPSARVVFETTGQAPIEVTSYLLQDETIYLRSSRIPESPALDTAAVRKIFKPKEFFFPTP